MSLTIGKIEYANCVPLFRALESLGDSPHHFVQGVPAVLNAMLSSGEINLSPSSSIVYGNDPDRYLLLPDLSISATGPVRSVLLFSKLPIEQLDAATIGLTNESDTSVALLKILLIQYFGITNHFVRTDMMPHDPENPFAALLLIGDQAMRESMNVSGYHVYDLGELWFRFTGLPFVYALWVVNRKSVVGKEEEVYCVASSLLDAKANSRHILSSCSSGSDLEWYGVEKLISYWNTISYDLGPQEMAGLSTFYRNAAELGIIREAPPLSFFAR